MGTLANKTGAKPVSAEKVESLKDKALSLIGGATGEFAGGALGGWADELYGLGQRMMPYPYGQAQGGLSDEEYRRQSASTMRENQAQFREEYPKTALGLNIAGGTTTALTGGGALNATRGGKLTLEALDKMNKLKSGALIGGTTGTVYGAGEADTGDTLGGAVTGGLMGSLLGAGFPLATSLGKYLGSKVSAPFVSLYKRFDDPTRAAVNHIIQMFERDGKSPDEAVKMLETLGDNSMLVDAGGTQTKRFLDYIVNSTGATADQAMSLLKKRVSDQYKSINRLVGKMLGTKGDMSGTQMKKALKERQLAIASPLYAAAKQSGVNFKGSGIDDILLRLPDKVFKESDDLARMEGALLNKMVGTNAQGIRAVAPASYGIEQIDLIKKAIDVVVAKDIRAGGLTDSTRKLIQLKNKMLGIADDAVPDYAAARGAWAEEAANETAIELGEKFTNIRPDELEEVVAGMGDTEKLFFKYGVARSIKDKMAIKVEGRDLTPIFNTQDMKERLSAVFDSEDVLNDFIGEMERYHEQALVNRMMYGSQTAGRQEIKNYIEGTTETPTSAIDAIFGFFKGDKEAAFEPMRNVAGQILTETDPAKVRNILAAPPTPISIPNIMPEGVSSALNNFNKPSAFPILPPYLAGLVSGQETNR